MDAFWVSSIICGRKRYRKNSYKSNNLVGTCNNERRTKVSFSVGSLTFGFKIEDFENFATFVSGSYGPKTAGTTRVP